MEKEYQNNLKDRMIHIRLDQKMHRELKILTAQEGITIQKYVENLIKNNINKPFTNKK